LVRLRVLADYIRTEVQFQINAGVKMASGAVSGYVLTSDASGVGTWQVIPATEPTAHAMVGDKHIASGLTIGHTIRATGATTFAWQQLQHADLGGVTADQHHAQAHVMVSSDHTASGLTTGHVIKATGATTFAWGYVDKLDDVTLVGANRRITFDTDDYLQYVSDTYTWYIGGFAKLYLDTGTLKVATSDGISLFGTNRRITFDANDYIQYASDTYDFKIGDTSRLTISATAINFYAATYWNKTGTAVALTQYPSYAAQMTGSGWDTTLLAAQDLHVLWKLIPGSGATGAIPYRIGWFKTDLTTEFLTFDVLNGRVGIGTTSPTKKLTIVSGGSNGILMINTSGAGTGIILSANVNNDDNKQFWIGDVDYLSSSSGFFNRYGVYGGYTWYDVVRGDGIAYGALNLCTNLGGTVAIGGAVGVDLTSGSKLWVNGNVAIGANYKNAVAPSNGFLVEGNVGIGTATPNANALLDVSSTTKAFMPPRMTTTQRNAIPSPTAGMVIYNTTTSVLDFHNGSLWDAIYTAAKAVAAIEAATDLNLHFQGAKVFNSAAQSIASATTTVLIYNTEEYDTKDWATLATNNERITVTKAGYYLITGNVLFSSGWAANRVYLYIQISGVSNIHYVEQQKTATTGNPGLQASTVVKLVANDYVRLLTYQDSGSSRDTVANFVRLSVTYLGD